MNNAGRVQFSRPGVWSQTTYDYQRTPIIIIKIYLLPTRTKTLRDNRPPKITRA